MNHLLKRVIFWPHALSRYYQVITTSVSYLQYWSQYCPNFLYCRICFANPSDIWCKASGHVALTRFPLDHSHQLLSCNWNYEKFKRSQWWVARQHVCLVNHEYWYDSIAYTSTYCFQHYHHYLPLFIFTHGSFSSLSEKRTNNLCYSISKIKGFGII